MTLTTIGCAVRHGDTRMLIDCGPDIRQQLMPFDFRPLTAVLLTHVHYDHVGGLDDLRPFSTFGDINIYADETTVGGIHRAMPYCFTEHLTPECPGSTYTRSSLTRPSAWATSTCCPCG